MKKALQMGAKSKHRVTVPPGVAAGEGFEHGLSEALGCELGDEQWDTDQFRAMRRLSFSGIVMPEIDELRPCKTRFEK